jgi:lysophospholipase L1-like esterase
MTAPTRRLAGLGLVAVLVTGLTGVWGVAPASAATLTTPTDSHVRYFGRWDTSDVTDYASMWTGAYVKVGFTGTTVSLRQRRTIDLWASIDGGADVRYTNVSGTVNLTPTPLRSGNHTLRVSYRAVAGSYTGDAVFGGLVLDSGATTFTPSTAASLVEFVGDSITVGQLSSQISLTSYAWLSAEADHAEHTQIAQGGACLTTTADGCVGLDRAFLNTGSTAGSPPWNFSRYTAKVVVINLGTNDVGHGVSTVAFQANYTAFLRTVRSKYPAATILAMETFRLRYVTQTAAAVAAVNAAGDTKVHYVNTEGWIDPATDTVDNVHPNDQGHRKIAARLAPIIAGYLG